MSAVIKHGATNAARVRDPLEAFMPPAPSSADEPVISVEVVALRREVDELKQRLAQRDSEVERLRNDVNRAYREGEAEGRKLGREESDARRADYLATLEQGVRAACDQFSGEVLGLERLAAEVAREALAKLIGDPTRHGELLFEAINHQLEQVESTSVVAVFVSQADFEQGELAQLAASLARRGVEFSISEELERGECRIKLKLGVLHVGLLQQWGRLDRTLRDLAAEVAA